MRQRNVVIIMLLLALLLSACGGDEKYEPFPELSKQTVSPQREAELQSALNGEMPTPTDEPYVDYTEYEPVVAPTFDENSFFAEVEPDPDYEPYEEPFVPDDEPFEPEPTATFTPMPTNTPMPTDTPMPTPTKPYDPNITMYGTSNGLTTYTLQEGEDLICLGQRFNVSVPYLMAQNGLSDPYEVGPGYIVLLPRMANGWSQLDGYGPRRVNMHPTTYTVQSGDTLFSIACLFGDVKPEDIAVQNKLVLGDPLPAGLAIVIP